MEPSMPTPEDLRAAPELALLAALAACLEAVQLSLAANYPDLYEHEGNAGEPYNEQTAYATAVFSQIDALQPLVRGYIASVRRAISPGNRPELRPDDVSF